MKNTIFQSSRNNCLNSYFIAIFSMYDNYFLLIQIRKFSSFHIITHFTLISGIFLYDSIISSHMIFNCSIVVHFMDMPINYVP